jgi:hypothetical protein
MQSYGTERGITEYTEGSFLERIVPLVPERLWKYVVSYLVEKLQSICSSE